MDSFHHTKIVPVGGAEALSELNKYLTEEEDKGYELYSLTELTNTQEHNRPHGIATLLVVSKPRKP